MPKSLEDAFVVDNYPVRARHVNICQSPVDAKGQKHENTTFEAVLLYSFPIFSIETSQVERKGVVNLEEENILKMEMELKEGKEIGITKMMSSKRQERAEEYVVKLAGKWENYRQSFSMNCSERERYKENGRIDAIQVSRILARRITVAGTSLT